MALEFRYRGEKYQGAGWNWMSFAKNAGADISRKENLSFWIKSRGSKPSDELQVNLVCATATPPHHHSDHTEKVPVSRYCPDLLDGQWHEVVVPMKDFARPDTFDMTKAFEIQFALHPAQAVDGSFFVDDITFDGDIAPSAPAPSPPGDKPSAAAPATTQDAAFSWSSDGSGEGTFVNSHHPVIPGHYEFVPDPAEFLKQPWVAWPVWAAFIGFALAFAWKSGREWREGRLHPAKTLRMVIATVLFFLTHSDAGQPRRGLPGAQHLAQLPVPRDRAVPQSLPCHEGADRLRVRDAGLAARHDALRDVPGLHAAHCRLVLRGPRRGQPAPLRDGRPSGCSSSGRSTPASTSSPSTA